MKHSANKTKCERGGSHASRRDDGVTHYAFSDSLLDIFTGDVKEEPPKKKIAQTKRKPHVAPYDHW